MAGRSPVQIGQPTTFDSLLAPVSVEEFVNDTFGRNPLHFQGEAGRFSHLLDWDGLARLLERHYLASPVLQIVRAGKTIPAERYLKPISSSIDRIDSGALSLLLESGATAIINHIDNLLPAVAALADEIGDTLSARTTVNLYASWRSDHGFNAHWDYHDFLILQLAGSKEWTIHKPTRPDPLRGDPFEAPSPGTEPDRVELLKDGDVLYLPRGWVHAPKPVAGPSMHLTIAIVRPTGAGFLSWFAKELEDNPEVRASIPLSTDEPRLDDWKRRMSDIVSAGIEAGAVERFLVFKDAKRGARPQFSFPDFGRSPHAEWTDETAFRCASLHRLIVDDSVAGEASVTAMGRVWPCNAGVAAALAKIRSTGLTTLGALEANLEDKDVAQLRQMLELLVKFGLVATQSP